MKGLLPLIASVLVVECQYLFSLKLYTVFVHLPGPLQHALFFSQRVGVLHHLSCVTICMHVRVYCTWYSHQFAAWHEFHHVKQGKLKKKVQFPVSIP